MLKPGSRVPDFSLESTRGSIVTLSLVTPLWPVLVIFFRTRCEACRVLLPHLENFQRQYGDADIEILAISQDGRLTTTEFIDEIRWPGRVLIDHPALEVSRAYGVELLPAACLIGTDMVLRATADASRLSDFESLAAAVAREVGWPYKPLLPPGVAVSVPCPSKTVQLASSM